MQKTETGGSLIAFVTLEHFLKVFSICFSLASMQALTTSSMCVISIIISGSDKLMRLFCKIAWRTNGNSLGLQSPGPYESYKIRFVLFYGFNNWSLSFFYRSIKAFNTRNCCILQYIFFIGINNFKCSLTHKCSLMKTT